MGIGSRLMMHRLSDSRARNWMNQSTPRLAEILATRAMVTGPETFCSEALPVTIRPIMASESAAILPVSRTATVTDCSGPNLSRVS
ncbi:hypothetical protein D3C73_1183900 [compost metagenome]